MIKNYTLSLLASFLLTFIVVAEEGMLIPSVLTAFESKMQAMGMKLSAKDIYDVNHSSLKDAIIHFNGGCTAEIVSNKGLILTNHHCGYSAIQSHSSLEKDYLKNGFWAKSFDEELPNSSLYAARMVRIDDVTAAVLFNIKESDSDEKKSLQYKKNVDQLIKDATNGTHYEAEIKPFNYGNDFYIIVKEIFTDVRLVGTPPNSIGKFGGDTDNWVWPRHTGDFSVFRIYANKENKPASFSKENVPYTPLHFLPISFGNRKVGDFTMVYGFPGQTEQHVSSSYLKYIIDIERPAKISMREKTLSVIDASMRSSDEIRIKYAAKQASIANAYKKWIGQIGGLKKENAVSLKIAYEKRYQEMANSKSEWREKYGDVILLMNQLVEENYLSDFKFNVGTEYFSIGPEYFKMAKALDNFIVNYPKYVEKNEIEKRVGDLAKGAENFYKNYDVNVDKRIFELLTDHYFKLILTPEEYYKTNVNVLSKVIYYKSIFTDKYRFLNFIKNFNSKSLKRIEKDLGYSFWFNKFSDFSKEIRPKGVEFQMKMNALLKTYVEGKKIMFPNDQHWPDANSTLRVAYGKIEGSQPADGMMYLEHTTTDGIIAKHQTGNPDFELLPGMVDLYEAKNFGEYAQDGELWVCFTGSNPTTGGNSGSPVIDGSGNLMGLNFDRTWESTMSDFNYSPHLCRNVVVDIRYVLWVMDKYAGAKHLVDEMVLVKH
ncbi:MAG: S46 family peptidase [Flavobacteriia bacterium]|nr:S46 family peptidase [Flavobacteriia bacterium]